MSIDPPTLTEVIEANIQNFAAARLWTNLTARVESFDPTTNSISAQPVTLGKNPDGPPEKMPLLINVPFEFPKFGPWSIEGPVTKGDYVSIAILKEPYDQWLLKGGVDVEESINAKYRLDYAVARAGPRPFVEALPGVSTTDFVIRHSSGNVVIRLEPDGTITIDAALLIKLGAGASELVALAIKTLTELNAIITIYNAHTHIAPPGGGVTAIPVAQMPVASSVAATKVQAE